MKTFEWLVMLLSSVTCQTLSTPTGGSISLITDGYQTHALVTCEVGYTLSGVRNMTCRSDGSWDFTNPACGRCETSMKCDIRMQHHHSHLFFKVTLFF